MPDDTTILDSESLLEIIQTAASGPEEVQTDAGRVKQFSLADLIAAHKYLAAAQLAEQQPPVSGLRFSQLIPPGAVQRGRWPTDAGGWYPWR
jgi:hypothetical protein